MSYPARTFKLVITDPNGEVFDGFIILTYEDDDLFRLYRLDISASKVGTVVRGLMDTLSAAINNAIKAGDESFRDLLRDMRGQVYSPKGQTSDPEIPTCTSLADYLAKRIIMGAPRI